MSFSKHHAAEKSKVTQGGVEQTQGTQDPPLGLCLTPKTSQDLDKSSRFSGFDRGHREVPHWLSLSMDVGLYAVSIETSQPIEGGRDVKFNILALVQYLENFVRGA